MSDQLNNIADCIRQAELVSGPDLADAARRELAALRAKLAEVEKKHRDALVDLGQAYNQLAYNWSFYHTCPCGARPESPHTHPHVTGCPTGKAVELENDVELRLSPPIPKKIVCTPGICGGKARFDGTRFDIETLLKYRKRRTDAQILVDFPQLTQADIDAAVRYAAERLAAGGE